MTDHALEDSMFTFFLSPSRELFRNIANSEYLKKSHGEFLDAWSGAALAVYGDKWGVRHLMKIVNSYMSMRFYMQSHFGKTSIEFDGEPGPDVQISGNTFQTSTANVIHRTRPADDTQLAPIFKLCIYMFCATGNVAFFNMFSIGMINLRAHGVNEDEEREIMRLYKTALSPLKRAMACVDDTDWTYEMRNIKNAILGTELTRDSVRMLLPIRRDLLPHQ